MSDKFQLTIGQAHELEMALGKVGGWSPLLVRCMCEGDNLARFRRVLLGQAEIQEKKHVINCDTTPFIPDGWCVAEECEQIASRVKGDLTWDPTKVELYLSELQRSGKDIQGEEFRKKLKGKLVLPANVLDYLLEYPHLIPEEWKKNDQGRTRYIFFWGTIYRDSDGYLCVRDLCWFDGEWTWYYCWLDCDWDARHPAALLAS
jgi:hypothetical protein